MTALELFDPEFVQHAASAVFHYFKYELGRQTVTVGEFAGALENVLRGFAVTAQPAAQPAPWPGCWSPICPAGPRSRRGRELFFFPRLRAELRQQLQQAPARSALSRAARLR